MKKLTSIDVKKIRLGLGLKIIEFANIIGLGSKGHEKVILWENGEKLPSAMMSKSIIELENFLNNKLQQAPFKHIAEKHHKFKFIDLFAGTGGMRIPFQSLGGECVFTSEIDRFAQRTYLTNFGVMPSGDITKINVKDIPNHDLLLAGFPCQAFSQAGLRKGFYDTRGTRFFDIQNILSTRRPKSFLLENVKQLRGHDNGRTLNTILSVLRGQGTENIPTDISLSLNNIKSLGKKLNYWVDARVLRARDFGVPQNRERIYIVGFDLDQFTNVDFEKVFSWPIPPKTKTRLGDILEDNVDSKYTISDKIWDGHKRRKTEHLSKGNGFGYSLFNKDSVYTNTLLARYYKDGSEILIDQSEKNLNPRKLTPRECARLQGFPDEFKVDAVSNTQIYKQLGNAVCLNVVSAVAKSMIDVLLNIKSNQS